MLEAHLAANDLEFCELATSLGKHGRADVVPQEVIVSVGIFCTRQSLKHSAGGGVLLIAWVQGETVAVRSVGGYSEKPRNVQ